MNLVFCDTETTGLDPAKCYILELALVAVSLPDFREVARMNHVVRPPMWETVKRNLPERVFKMHTDSGLIAEVDALPELNGGAVENEACAFVSKHAPDIIGQPGSPLAGAGPDFDRRFLAKHMPKLVGRFGYRNFDVRSLTQLQEWVFGIPHTESPHRAMSDTLKAIQDVRDFLGIPA